MCSLELLDLLEETDQVTDWYMLGVYLKMPHDILDDIEKRLSTHGVKRCKTEMFVLWKRRTVGASWEQIKVALEKCGELALAEQVYERQCAASDNQQSQKEDPSPPVIKLDKKLIKQFTVVEREFTDVVHNLRISLKAKQVPLAELQQYLEIRLEKDGQLAQSTTVDQLFHLISPHYCFLNTVILMDVIDKFIGEPLKKQLEKYESHLDEFTESAELSILKEVQSRCPSGVDMPQVVFKLTGFWPSVTIKHFKRFVDQIFGAESSALTHIRVKGGCICVSWFARKSVLSSLIDLAQQKVEFMRQVGVLRLTIGNTVILDQEEVDEEDIDMHTALLLATNADCAEAVELLLSFGADPNCISELNGSTPLIIACDRGSTSIVTMLLSAHADVNIQNDHGWPPLMVVCYSHTPNIDLVKLLVQSGADINVDSGGILKATALVRATMCGHTQIVQYLLDKGADVNARTKDGHSSLMIACRYNRQDIVRILLNYRADTNTRDSETTSTALHFACKEQRATAVELLLAHGADPNVLNNLECTPLMHACMFFSQPMEPTIPVMLLSAGANPNIQSRDGVTALMRAAQYNYQEGVEALLNAGADVNTQNLSGGTALHYAAYEGHSAVTQLLLTSGASTLVTDYTGSTPLDLALDSGHQDVCQLLLSSLDQPDPSATTQIKKTQPCPFMLQPHPQQPVLQQPHIQPDTFSTIHQLRYALEHPLSPADTVKHHQADDHDNEEEHVDTQS